MHTLGFTTAVLIANHDGGQYEGPILLRGPDPNAVPREAWESLFELRGEAAWCARTVEVIADLDALRRQAKEPGPDDEFLVLHLPLDTLTQDRYDPAVLAHLSGATGPDAPSLAMGHLLVRRRDLRELALDIGWARAANQIETLNDRMFEAAATDALAQVMAQDKLLAELDQAMVRLALTSA